MADGTDRRNSVVAGIALLLLRGLLLWVVVPLAMIFWLVGAVWLWRRGTSLGRFLGWVDLNLIALLARGPLRPIFRAPPPWVPVRGMSQVTHRVGDW